MTAWYSARLGQADWRASKLPERFSDWLTLMTVPQRTTRAERIAAFEALARHGFAVTVSTRVQ